VRLRTNGLFVFVGSCVRKAQIDLLFDAAAGLLRAKEHGVVEGISLAKSFLYLESARVSEFFELCDFFCAEPAAAGGRGRSVFIDHCGPFFI